MKVYYMKPKIAYLIDENEYGLQDPHWVWYSENDATHRKIERMDKSRVKRIVYWEIEE